MVKTKQSPKVKKKSKGLLTGSLGAAALGMSGNTLYNIYNPASKRRFFEALKGFESGVGGTKNIEAMWKQVAKVSKATAAGYGAVGAGLLYKSHRSRKALKKGKK